MAAANNKKVLIGGIAVAVLLVLGVIVGFSFNSGEQQSSSPNRVAAQDADDDLDSAPVASRTTPGKDAGSSGRLAGASNEIAPDDSGQDQALLKEKKKRASKRRKGRKKRKTAEEDELEEKKAGKREDVNRPF